MKKFLFINNILNLIEFNSVGNLFFAKIQETCKTSLRLKPHSARRKNNYASVRQICIKKHINHLEDPVLGEIVSPWHLHDLSSKSVRVSHLGHCVWKF